MTEIRLFWLIHVFIGVVLPAMMFSGCCKEKADSEIPSDFQPG